MAEEWIVVGEVTAPQGVRGEMRVMPATDFPERLQALQACHMRHRDGSLATYAVRSVRPHKGFYLFQLDGVNDRDAAEALRGSQVVVSRADVMPLPEGRYYIFELVGMQVSTDSGEPVGVLKDVISGPGNDIYVVARQGRPDALIPAVRQMVQSIDVAARRMVITPIPGLLDEAEGDSRSED